MLSPVANYAATARIGASKGPHGTRYCSVLISCHYWAPAPAVAARRAEIVHAGLLLVRSAGQTTSSIDESIVKKPQVVKTARGTPRKVRQYS